MQIQSIAESSYNTAVLTLGAMRQELLYYREEQIPAMQVHIRGLEEKLAAAQKKAVQLEETNEDLQTQLSSLNGNYVREIGIRDEEIVELNAAIKRLEKVNEDLITGIEDHTETKAESDDAKAALHDPDCGCHACATVRAKNLLTENTEKD